MFLDLTATAEFHAHPHECHGLEIDGSYFSYHTREALVTVDVEESGLTKLSQSPLAQVPEIYEEFCYELRDRVIFKIPSPAALRRFARASAVLHGRKSQPAYRLQIVLLSSDTFLAAEKLRRWPRYDPEDGNDQPHIHFGVPRNLENDLNDDDSDSSDEPDDKMYHGYHEKVEEHIREWMKALDCLPLHRVVDVTMENPWLHFDHLRVVTAPLRQTIGDYSFGSMSRLGTTFQRTSISASRT